MSNFICKECGMTNIDCGYAGYKTPKEIELEKKLNIAVEALEEIEKNATRKDIQTITVLCVNNWLLARKALKEINLVGTSTKE